MPDKYQHLTPLIAEVARLHSVLERGRQMQASGEAIISETIKDYVAAQNRLTAAVSELVRSYGETPDAG